MDSSVIPAEAWPPYKALWSKYLVLARNDEGDPIPWTHGVRNNSALWLPIFGVTVGWVIWGGRPTWWRSLLSFGLGFLAGHFWW